MYNVIDWEELLEMREKFELHTPLNHIAFIMDGNGRWAKSRLLPRHLGHKEGCKRIIEILRACMDFHIYCISLYAFSTENWKRPKDEIDHLFTYLEIFFRENIDELMEKGVKVHVMGDLSRLPEKTQNTIQKAMDLTSDCPNHIFNICLNYGGRDEIIKAAMKYAELVKNGKENVLTEEQFEQYMMCADLPKLDLLVRTSGEVRLSNYMLWEMAYAEMIFTPVRWPDFHVKDLVDCLKEYEKRNRRFGGI